MCFVRRQRRVGAALAPLCASGERIKNTLSGEGPQGSPSPTPVPTQTPQEPHPGTPETATSPGPAGMCAAPCRTTGKPFKGLGSGEGVTQTPPWGPALHEALGVSERWVLVWMLPPPPSWGAGAFQGGDSTLRTSARSLLGCHPPAAGGQRGSVPPGEVRRLQPAAGGREAGGNHRCLFTLCRLRMENRGLS